MAALEGSPGAADVLEGEREDLAASLRNLGIAMEQVSSFVRDNEQALSQNVKGLALGLRASLEVNHWSS